MSTTIVRSNSNSNNYSTRTKTSSIFLLLPIFFIVAILPLIMKTYTYDPKVAGNYWYDSSTQKQDFFLFYKQWFFVGVCSLMLLILIFRAWMDKKTLRFTPIMIPVAIYAILAFISTTLSKHSSFGFSGVFDQFENVFCLIGYALTIYYVFLILETEDEVRMLLYALAIGALIVGLIGSFQSFGHDFFRSRTGKALLFGSPDAEVSFAFDEKYVYSTLYNPNYVGVYTSIIIPLFSTLLFFSKKWSERILYLLVIITNILSLFGSRSKAGFVSIIVSFFFLAILMGRFLIKKWFITVPILVFGVVAFFIVNAVSGNSYINSIKNVFNTKDSYTAPALSKITTEDNFISITYNNETLYLSMGIDENNTITFHASDSTSNELNVFIDETGSSLRVDDPRFSFMTINTINYNNSTAFAVTFDGQTWYFTNQTEDSTYYYINPYGNLVKMDVSEKALPAKMNSFATNRGYLWSTTLPLLKDRIILGSGADSFVFEWPHNDYVAKYNYGFINQILSKPHSLYLQIGVQTGIISLLAFLAIYFMYFISSIKLYLKNDLDNFFVQAGIAIFVGLISYMVSGLTNDSTITIAPTFWVLLGTGISINALLKHNSAA